MWSKIEECAYTLVVCAILAAMFVAFSVLSAFDYIRWRVS